MASRMQTIGEALATGISLPTRTLYIVGDIDDDKLKLIHLGVDLLDRPDSIITVLLSTQGGFTSVGLAIYDALRACQATVRIIGTGAVYSMGTIILQAGDERLLTPNTRVHIHEGSTEVGRQPIAAARASIQDSEKLDGLTWAILSEKIGLSVREVKKRFSRERYMSAQEAIALGLADGLVEA